MPKQINLEMALCAGMDTNLFYMFEDDLLKINVNLIEIRQICFACPIQKACLEYGFKREKFGMFGGVTEMERELIRKKKWNNPKMEKFLSDLAALKVSINSILPFAEVETEYL